MAQLTVGIKVEYDVSGASSSYAELPGVTSIPTLVGDPSSHDITTLTDEQKVYIPGLPDNGGTLGFGVLITPEVIEAVETIQAAQKRNKINWKITIPAPVNKCWKFDGEVTALVNDEVTPDNPLTGKVNVIPSTAIKLGANE